MMQSNVMPILLIDGNNLAHFLYTNLTPGQKMTPSDSRRLIDHLASYARTYAGQVQIELCLDRAPGPFDLPPENMHVFSAEYPQTGDDLLLGRFWFHHLAHAPCLVITNDETLLEEVAEAQGNSLRVYDFVRRPGLVTPVLRDPQDLPPLTAALAPISEGNEKALSLSTSIYFRIIEETRQEKKETASDRAAARLAPGTTGPVHLPNTIQEPSEPPAYPESQAVQEEPRQDGSPGNQPGPAGEETYYFLSLDTWPVAEGVRFLRNAFCREHRSLYLDLMEAFDPQTLTPADLRALAELLLHTCGDEPDFAQRGSLMARVRLALLQARGEPLTLVQIAQATGLKPNGLHGRIKDKAENWLLILQV